jgi:predicted tellurium resistance membrane protein TerC
MPFGFLGGFFDQLFNQTFDWPDMAVIGLLVLLEGVLSIDNALVLGLLAKRLPRHQRAKALSYGIIGAFVFRTIAVLTAAYLLQWTFVKFLGGAYLVYIAVKHLFFEAKEEKAEKIVFDEAGNPVLVDAATGIPITAAQEEIEIRERVPFDGIVDDETAEPASVQPSAGQPATAAAPQETTASWWRFWKTVAVIELTDIAFAVDSILAAIALAGGKQQKLWVIITGGLLGMLLMRVAARLFIGLLDRFPRFEIAAYLLVILIGMKLLVDWGFNSDWSFEQQKLIQNQLGPWKQTFADIEDSRRDLIHDYDRWLKQNWIFDVQHERAAEPAAEKKREGEILAPHVPHLLDFHDLRFPECMTFWVLMLLCFAVGFMPAGQTPAAASGKA